MAVTICLLAVCAWAVWVARTRSAPRWVRTLALLAAATMGIIGGYAVWKVNDVFTEAREMNPAERQSWLSGGLADAYRVLAIGGAAVAVAVLVCTVTMMCSSRGARG